MDNEIKFTTDSIYFLSKKLNPEFYEIVSESNFIMGKYGELMIRLKNLRIPKAFDIEYLLRPEIRFRETKEVLNKIGLMITDLDQKYVIPWKNKTSDFALKPNFILLPTLSPIEHLTVTTHYMDFIRSRIDQITDSIRTLFLMANQEADRYDNRLSNAKQIQLNVLIATLGYILAIGIAIFS